MGNEFDLVLPLLPVLMMTMPFSLSPLLYLLLMGPVLLLP
uniref:Uncharacterized protein n=1 Tax=Picea glauca TaxID=3330 RepID=A0A124GML5_PICGL|nr:hypothetical protein ABT39_MTgene2159 [Picea glauca]